MSREQDIYLANRAKEVLENEAYLKAFEEINAEIMRQWKNSDARDTEAREKCWLMQSLLGMLQDSLKATMDAGTLAQDALKYQQYKQSMQ